MAETREQLLRRLLAENNPQQLPDYLLDSQDAAELPTPTTIADDVMEDISAVQPPLLQTDLPTTSAVPPSIIANADREQPVDYRNTTKVQSSASSEVQKAFQKSGQLPDSNNEYKQSDDFEQKLATAKGQDNDRNTLFGLLRASQQAGSALANTKADTSFADSNLASPNKYTEELTADQKARKLNNDLQDENILRSPSSEISQQARAIAKRVGLKVGENVSAKQLQDAGLNISNLLSQQLAIDARKEQAELQREAMKMTREEKQTAAKEKGLTAERDKVDKLVNNFTKSDDYKGYQAAKTAEVALDNALAEGNKAAIGSAFMVYAKIAQGDNSVVRESDMANLAGRFNYSSPSEMISKLSAKAKGAGFTTQELQQMRQIAEVIKQTKAKQVQSQLRPIEARFEKYGLNPDESLDPAVRRELLEAKTMEPKSSGLTTNSSSTARAPSAQKSTVNLPAPQAPGTMINQKSTGKRYQVNADGKTATEI